MNLSGSQCCKYFGGVISWGDGQAGPRGSVGTRRKHWGPGVGRPAGGLEKGPRSFVAGAGMMRALCLVALAARLAAATAEEALPGGTNPLSFSATCGDFMVLQQAPAKAAVVGILNVSGSVAPVSVDVSGGPGASYTVQAVVTKIGGRGAGYKWKAFLQPTRAGGDFTITATSGAMKAEISHVTFGDGAPRPPPAALIPHYRNEGCRTAAEPDTSRARRAVWYCSGQSNMVCDPF